MGKVVEAVKNVADDWNVENPGDHCEAAAENNTGTVVGPTLLNRMLGPKLGNDQKTRTAFVWAAKEAQKQPSKKVTIAFRRICAYPYGTKRRNPSLQRSPWSWMDQDRPAPDVH